MSTRCRIGIEQSDGTIKSVYCHSDGYIEGVGEILKKNYNNPDKIEELVNLGDLSSLGTWYDPEEAKKRWNMGYSEVKALLEEEQEKYWSMTVPYSSRGEECPARVDENYYELMSKLGNCGEEFTYLFKADYDGVYKWFVCETPYMNPLDDELDKLKEEE